MARCAPYLVGLVLLGLVGWGSPVRGAFAFVAAPESEDPADVALDPGHSSWDVGAAGGGLREYELTLDVATRTRGRLEALGYRVRLTREDQHRVAPAVPADPTAATEAEQQARHRAAGSARVYVSIHFNGHPDPTLRGTETYFNGDNHGRASRRLAAEIHRATVATLSAAGYLSRDRGVREDLAAGKPYGHFFTLRGPFPSALIEVLFLSNPSDMAIAREEAAREAVAQGIATGISAFLAEEDEGL
jgi:N-acetylmuramoyl-L-alanine amidase